MLGGEEKIGEERKRAMLNQLITSHRSNSSKEVFAYFSRRGILASVFLEENKRTMIGGKPFDVESLLRDCAVKKKRAIHETIQIYDRQQQQQPPPVQHQATDLTLGKDKIQIGMFSVLTRSLLNGFSRSPLQMITTSLPTVQAIAAILVPWEVVLTFTASTSSTLPPMKQPNHSC